MTKFPHALAAGTAVAVVAVALGASPAFASVNTLPTDNSLYTIDSSGIYETTASGAQTLLDLQLYSGAGQFNAGALNPLDNHAYLAFTPDGLGDVCAIDSVDMLGGTPGPHTLVTGYNMSDCYGLNVDANGNALIEGINLDDSNHYVWQINLQTGALTNPVQIENELFGFTVSPSGDWVGLVSNGTLVQIDKTTGAFTTLVNTTLTDVYDCKFDSDGTLWFTDEEGSGPPYQLYSWRSGDTDYTLQGNLSVGGDETNGLYGPVFVGNSTAKIAELEAAKAALPNTGLNVSGYASLALVLALTGAALVVRRRATRA